MNLLAISHNVGNIRNVFEEDISEFNAGGYLA